VGEKKGKLSVTFVFFFPPFGGFFLIFCCFVVGWGVVVVCLFFVFGFLNLGKLKRLDHLLIPKSYILSICVFLVVLNWFWCCFAFLCGLS